MVDYCANPECKKPLHYLREGAVFIFDVPEAESREPNSHRLEHYWLCGNCSAVHRLERTVNNEVRLVPKEPSRFVRRKQPEVVTADQVISFEAPPRVVAA
jgi:hypothetical protein